MIKNQAGDTIVEVLLSTVVIAIVLSGAYALTNRATRINQSAIERTMASKLMQEQIELIRGAQTKGAGSATWQAIVGKTSQAPNYNNCAPNGPNAFYMSTNLINNTFDFENKDVMVNYTPATPEQGFLDASPNDNFRVWVEKIQPLNANYADFHIRACWEGIGGEIGQSAAIVMRLAL